VAKLNKRIGLVQKSIEGYAAKRIAKDYETKVPGSVKLLNSQKEETARAELAEIQKALAILLGEQ
jgi:hypothetical protein